MPRDIRIDRIGFVKELVERFADPLREKVRGEMSDDERREGDFFTGLRVGRNATSIDAAKFVEAFYAGKMTRAQFESAIKINIERAREILGEKDLERISTTAPLTPSLIITKKKTVQIELVKAVQELNSEIGRAA